MSRAGTAKMRRMSRSELTPAQIEPSAAPRWIDAVAWLVVAAGAAMQVAHYIGGRPLWLDEAMVALNILHLSPGELLGRLDYDQVAPPGWLLLGQQLSRLPMPPEYSLRLPALAASLAGLALFRALAFRMLGGLGALAALTLFAISPVMVRYAAEVKPYATDAFFASAILWQGLDLLDQERLPPWRTSALFAVGLIGVLFSLPVVYVLGGVGGLLILHRLRARRWTEAAILAAVALAWAAAFLGVYLEIYRPQTTDTIVTVGESAAYFRMFGYAPLPPWSLGDLLWFFDWGDSSLVFFFGSGSRFAAVLAAAAGLAALALRWSWRGGLICAAPILALAGSALQTYPLHERLLLFLAPNLMLLVGAGIAWIAARSRPPVPAWALLLGLCVAGGLPTLQGNLRHRPPFEIMPMPALLETIARDRRPGDVIYVSNQAIPAYLFYKNRHGLSDVRWIAGRTPASSWSCIAQDLASARLEGRVWVLFSFVAMMQPPDEEALPLALAAHGLAAKPRLAASGWNSWLFELPLRRGPVPAAPAPKLACGLEHPTRLPPRLVSRVK